MISLAFAWFCQDLLQVFSMGLLIVPELFLLYLLFRMLSSRHEPTAAAKWIWVGFLGGILWDLRWTNLPGLSGALNAAMIALVAWLWHRTPSPARTSRFFAVIAGGAHLFSGGVHFLAWGTPSQTLVRLFAIQQCLAIPVLAVLCVIYAWKVPESHV